MVGSDEPTELRLLHFQLDEFLGKRHFDDYNDSACSTTKSCRSFDVIFKAGAPKCRLLTSFLSSSTSLPPLPTFSTFVGVAFSCG